MKKSILFLLPVSCLLLLASCGHSTKPAAARSTDVIPVQIITVGQTAGNSGIPLSGQFTTNDEAMLGFKTSGVINSILVKEGEAIREGQLLATLNLTEVNAQVQQAQLGYEKAQRDYQRVTNLYTDSVATLEQWQNSRTGLDIARQQLNTAQFNRRYAEIRAVKNGFVLRKLASEGQVVSSGTAVLQTNGAGTTGWILKAGAGDRDWAAIHINDKAVVTLDNNSEQQYEGTVIRKSESTDPATGTFSIEIRLADSHAAGVASGVFGRAMVAASGAAQSNNQWSLPYDALLDADGSNGYVFVAQNGTVARKVKVTIAGMSKDAIQVSGGLEAGQQVIVSGSAYLTDNSPIKITR